MTGGAVVAAVVAWSSAAVVVCGASEGAANLGASSPCGTAKAVVFVTAVTAVAAVAAAAVLDGGGPVRGRSPLLGRQVVRGDADHLWQTPPSVISPSNPPRGMLWRRRDDLHARHHDWWMRRRRWPTTARRMKKNRGHLKRAILLQGRTVVHEHIP